MRAAAQVAAIPGLGYNTRPFRLNAALHEVATLRNGPRFEDTIEMATSAKKSKARPAKAAKKPAKPAAKATVKPGAKAKPAAKRAVGPMKKLVNAVLGKVKAATKAKPAPKARPAAKAPPKPAPKAAPKPVAKPAPVKAAPAKPAPVTAAKNSMTTPSNLKAKTAAAPAVKSPAAPVVVASATKPAARPAGMRVAVAVPKEDAKKGKAGKPGRREDQKKLALVRVTLPEGYKPAQGEEYMSANQLEYFRHKLIKWREELVEESKQTIDNLREEVRDVGDEAERATRETENSLELRTRDRYRKLISKIDKALKRIDDGEYGFCEETGEEIGLERLEARPIATLCLDAQERWEHRQRQMGD